MTNQLLNKSNRSRVDSYKNYIHLVLQFPICELCYSEKSKESSQEIHFIIGKDFLITLHYEFMQALNEFGQIFESLSAPNGKEHLHAGHLFLQIQRQLYRSLDLGLDLINSELEKVKKEVFAGKEKEMVLYLSEINQNLIDFQWSLRTHDEVLKALDLSTSDLFDENFAYYVKVLKNEYLKIWDTFKNNKAIFEDIRRTNESLLTIKTNEVMKVLTILAFTTFPLSVFTSLFGMNTELLPLVGLPYDFWIIVGIMVVTVAIMFTIFKKKKWF